VAPKGNLTRIRKENCGNINHIKEAIAGLGCVSNPKGSPPPKNGPGGKVFAPKRAQDKTAQGSQGEHKKREEHDKAEGAEGVGEEVGGSVW